jgi:hypothetical protein
MAIKFNLSYYYITEENDSKLLQFSEASSDTRQTLIMQYVRGWIGRNRTYYTNLARLDCAKRKMNYTDWTKIVVDEGFSGLPSYQTSIAEGEIPTNPLAHIVLPSEILNKSINYIFLSRQNYILLRTAIYYDGGKISAYISRIIQEHIQRNWDALYLPQIQAEHSDDWLKGE